MNQTELDQVVHKARRVHREFREKHWAYFNLRGRVHPLTGKEYVPDNHSLNAESTRLFEEVRKAEQLAWVGPTRAEGL